MRKQILLMVASLCLTWNAGAYDFFAVNADGDTLYYNILSTSPAAVEVTYSSVNAIGLPQASYRDSICIPATATSNGTTYAVTAIGSEAFYYCSNLTSIIIPTSVTSIGNNAFFYCSGLTSVAIPSSVTSIGSMAFYGCSGLTSVSIPNTVTTISGGTFSYCSGLTSVTIPNSVTSIGSEAFYGCSGLVSVTIPNSATYIGGMAFHSCSSLASVSIPNSVTSIGIAVFEGTAWYNDSTNWTGDVLYEGHYLIEARNSLSGNYTIQPGTTCLAGWAFYGCDELDSVFFPNTLVTIGEGAFVFCTGLHAVTIPNSVTSIKKEAFSICRGLNSVTLSNSLTAIADGVFYSCSGLTAMTIPNSVTSIGSNAFRDCSGLISVAIPSSVSSIGNNAFNNCYALTSLTIPEALTAINAGAFSHCSGLTSIIIPPSVTTIGDSAFYVCSHLTSITIPATVDSIGSYAFRYCLQMEYISSRAAVPPAANANTFAAIHTDIPLYVPCDASPAYRAAVGWDALDSVVEDCIKITVLSNNEALGTVSGGGTYLMGDTATLTAAAYEGGVFGCWSDGSLEASRQVVVHGPATYTAYFDSIEVGIDEAERAAGSQPYPNPTESKLTIGEVAQLVEAYDRMGRRVASWQHTDQVDLSALPAGIYTLRIHTATGATARKVMKR